MDGGGEELGAGGFGLGEFACQAGALGQKLGCHAKTRRREEDRSQVCSLWGFAPSRPLSSFHSAAPFDTRDNPSLINSAPKLMR